jgi:cytidyltransferase-like protein
MNDTVILITTFLRDELLVRCLKSVRKFYPDIPLYVGDNGYATTAKKALCKKIGAIYLELPFDCGVGGVRNEAIARLPERFRYIAIIEDDIVLREKGALERWRAILDAEPGVGIVGGKLLLEDGKEQHYEATTWIKGRDHHIKAVENPEWRTTPDGTRYFLCDLILNVFLIRREVWDEVQWDEQFKTAFEHSDFFLRLKYAQETTTRQPVFDDAGKLVERPEPIRVAYAPDVVFDHLPEEDAQYKKYRRRPAGFALFGDKWRVKLGYSSFNKKNPVPYFIVGGDVGTKDRAFVAAIDAMMKARVKRWWLEAGTCLGIVRDGDFIAHDTDIDFGLAGTELLHWERLQARFLEAGFTLHKAWTLPISETRQRGPKPQERKIELSFKYADVKVDLFFFFNRGDWIWHGAWGPGKDGRWEEGNLEFLPHVFPAALFENLQEIMFKGVRCFLPNPPEEYLAARYGPDWKTPNKAYQYWRDCRAVDRAWLRERRVAFIGGVWDLFHVGHLRIIRRAAGIGTELVVGVLTDEAAAAYKDHPVIPFEERRELVESVGGVTRTIQQTNRNPVADWEREELRPDYVIHGDDWSSCPGADEATAWGGKAVFLPYTQGVSTTDIRRRVKTAVPKPAPAAVVRPASGTLAVGIKTFYREEALFRTVASVKKAVPPPFRLYIADDSPPTAKKDAFYAALEAEGHRVLRLPLNSGISYGRNSIVAAIDSEDRILMMDDDIEIGDKALVAKLGHVLDDRPDIGVVAGVLVNEGAGQMIVSDGYSHGLKFEFDAAGYLRRWPVLWGPVGDGGGKGGGRFAEADQVINFFLARREVFETTRWDDRIKVEYEHLDFFLSLHKEGRWKSAVCFDARAVHQRTIQSDAYMMARRSGSIAYLLQKWNLAAVFNHF